MFKPVYDFFSSVKLAIVLLISLAVTSIVGTVIEQQKDPESYLKEYGEFTYKIFKFLGFTDVYHSWWYIALLVLLATNIVVCSLRRFPHIWKVVAEPKKTLPEGREKNLAVFHSITAPVPAEELVPKVLRALKALKYSVEVQEEGERVHIFADKNVYARFGVYVVHLGVLIVLIGGLVTAIFGYKGYMDLAQGTESNLVMPFTGNRWRELPFSVRCNSFEIETYPSGMPKAYKADLSVIENGVEVKRKVIKVNDPLKYKGIYFYQSSWGKYVAYLVLKDAHGSKVVKAASGQPVKVGDDTLVTPIVVEIKDKTGKPIAIDSGVEVVKGDKSKTFRVLPGRFYPLPFDTSTFVSMRVFFELNTGLQVSKDPGTWIVWLGSTVLIVGLIVAFFVPHKRVWARVEKKGADKARLVIGGTTNKGVESLEGELESVLSSVKTA